MAKNLEVVLDQMNVTLDARLKKRLKKRLVDEGTTIRAWIEQQIVLYCKAGINKNRHIPRRRIKE